MKQAIHIFQKDLRRFSWEIAASLILLTLYAWCQPASWLPLGMFFRNSGNSLLRYQGAMFAGLLLVLAWMFLLVRLVQEESPAGDKQFWITRPYRWPSLLAAKALFVVTVVNFPLLIAQLGLLRAAGFTPFHHPEVLLFIHLGLGAIFLPFIALAAISGNRTQLTRVAIVALIFLIGWLALGTSGSFGIDISWYGSARWNWAESMLLFGVPLAVIVWQYARRKTVQSRWILLGGALALCLLSAVEPKRTLNEAAYPLLDAGAGPYFQTYMGAAPEEQKNRAVSIRALSQDRSVMIDLNLYGGDVAEGQVVQGKAVRVTLQAADGAKWTSDWNPLFNIMEHEENPQQQPPPERDWRRLNTLFEVDKGFFDRYKDAPLSVHVVTAATLFRDHAVPIAERGDDLVLPGIGFCVTSDRPFAQYVCRSDMNHVPVLGITRRLFRSCPPNPGELLRPSGQITNWAPSGGSERGLSPVEIFSPFLQREETQTQPPGPCNDVSLLLRQPEKVRQFRTEKDFQNIKLADFVYQR